MEKQRGQNKMNISLAAPGALADRLQRRTACKTKMADGVWKGFGNRQLLLNKFSDPSTPSMRKVDNGEKKEKRKECRS